MITVFDFNYQDLVEEAEEVAGSTVGVSVVVEAVATDATTESRQGATDISAQRSGVITGQ